MLPRPIAVTAAAVIVAICWASAWGQALPLLRFTTPRLTRDLPRTQGPTGLPPQTWEVPKEMRDWVRECAPCWLQWDLHPGDWSASHHPLQCSQHAGSVPAQWDCSGQRAETGPMPQAPDGSKTVLSVSRAAPSSRPWPCPVGLRFFLCPLSPHRPSPGAPPLLPPLTPASRPPLPIAIPIERQSGITSLFAEPGRPLRVESSASGLRLAGFKCRLTSLQPAKSSEHFSPL